MITTHARARAAAAAVVAALTAATLSACGSSSSQTSASTPAAASAPSSATSASGPSSATSASAADHNQADVMFSMMMVPHHAQAVEMADLVPGRTENAELRALATQIKDAQQPEIDRMTGWLTGWGMTPMTDMSEHMGHMGMDGMMSEEEMTELEGLTGAKFDTMWLEMMIRHHEGAIEMAQQVLDTGSHQPTKELAEAIISGQQAEFDRMRTMLAG